jgi:hypothetical protein
MVQNENGTSAMLMADRMAMPVMIPGSARGSTRKTEMLSLPKKRNRPTAAAAIDPKTIAASEATSATTIDRRIASQSSGVSNACPNHFVVRPGGGKVNAASWVVKA